MEPCPLACLNDRVCSFDGDVPYCECPEGLIGHNCEAVLGDCSPDPCQNGGECQFGILVDTFRCACQPGSVGVF